MGTEWTPLTAEAGPAVGSGAADAQERPMELGYLDALAVYWRMYWPTQLAGFAWGIGYDKLIRAHFALSVLLWLLLTMAINVGVLWLAVPRIWGKPYRRGFDLAVAPAGGGSHLTSGQRGALFFAILWRQFAIGMVASLPAALLAALAGALRLALPPYFYLFVMMLAFGPMIVKLVCAMPFSGFRLLVRRPAPRARA